MVLKEQQKQHQQQERKEKPQSVPVGVYQHIQPRWNRQNPMRALVYEGKRQVSVRDHPCPEIVDPTDAIVRITTTTICGSDLHLYHGAIPETEKGDILGHEAVGIVESVGAQVTSVKPGARVVISAVIACGKCRYCKMNRFSNCDFTNPSREMEAMYGHRTAGLFGYSHLTGGYPGLQAQKARVPFADVNLLPLSSGVEDRQAILLSDVACTAWQAVLYSDLGRDTEHRTIAIWGAGPIGLCAAYYAKHVWKADRVVVIDNVAQRLYQAKELGCETLRFDYEDVVQKLRDMIPDGPDCCIDATGFRYAKSVKHRVETKIYAEQDAIDALTEAITAVRKSGTISIIGDYIGYANHFPIGAIMEKGLTLRSGQEHCQSYWRDLLGRMDRKEIDLNWMTLEFPFEEIDHLYAEFDAKKVLKPVFPVLH